MQWPRNLGMKKSENKRSETMPSRNLVIGIPGCRTIKISRGKSTRPKTLII